MIDRGGRFSLVRDDFQSFTSNSFKSMISREEFVDVTLACEDDKQFKAHKVILSACSEFFRNILVKNSHSHPLIYLDNLKAEQLEALVKFIYIGETNIPQSMVSDFIKAAQKYKIQGLTEHNDDVPVVRKRRPTGMDIKEEYVANEEARGEVLKHNIVDTLANSQSRMLEPETKLEVLDEDIHEGITNGNVQVELTQVDVIECMEESETENLVLDDNSQEEDEEDSADENVILSMARPKEDKDNGDDENSSDKEADYLPNENEEFSEEDDEEEEVGSGGIENTIEIESVVDRNEVLNRSESDGESIVNDDDSSDSDYDVSGEDESSDDDDESIADEDTECDGDLKDASLEEEADINDSKILVKEERTHMEDDLETIPVKVEDVGKHNNENNNKRIKREPSLDESDVELI